MGVFGYFYQYRNLYPYIFRVCLFEVIYFTDSGYGVILKNDFFKLFVRILANNLTIVH
ncbi:hypothetical protein SAMN04488009_1229 [Maribacter sedimenticola]|uniref:Uncharacterized protein n=1 Tax=Maribacter sedimenticola TaxID=228956 RepID=A0ABY1SEJ8_9FLAO|nr:hypothetical protein SAMN04488009_1229 [Maribacter sedimenticola]